MAQRKLIQVNANGSKTEYAGRNASTGVSEADEFIIADATGKMSATFLPNGVGADSTTHTAGEALAAGDFVYISGTGTVLKADATAIAKQARGYVLTSVLNAGLATVFFDESNSALSALTIGSNYFLSTTPGLATLTAPTVAGQIVQQLGFATSATSLHAGIQDAVIRV